MIIFLFALRIILTWKTNLRKAGGTDSDDHVCMEVVNKDSAKGDADGVEINDDAKGGGGESNFCLGFCCDPDSEVIAI